MQECSHSLLDAIVVSRCLARSGLEAEWFLDEACMIARSAFLVSLCHSFVRHASSSSMSPSSSSFFPWPPMVVRFILGLLSSLTIPESQPVCCECDGSVLFLVGIPRMEGMETCMAEVLNHRIGVGFAPA